MPPPTMPKEIAGKAPRREILSADLDRFDLQRALYHDERSDDGDALCDAVRAAVASALTDKQRLVVEAFFFEGRSQGDIARALGVTQQVVHKTLFGAARDGRKIGGALARLRTALAPHVLAARAAVS